MRVSELKEEMDARFAQVDARFAQVDARFEQVDKRFAQVDARFVEMQEQIASEANATRRHFDVVGEQLRSDIALIATGLATTNQTLERHIAESHSEHATILRILDNHEVRLTSLERSSDS
jgi:hypothetical protein